MANDGAKPELIYAQIEPDPQSSCSQSQAKATAPSVKENGAVIYSELQKNVEPSTDLHDNVSW